MHINYSLNFRWNTQTIPLYRDSDKLPVMLKTALFRRSNKWINKEYKRPHLFIVWNLCVWVERDQRQQVLLKLLKGIFVNAVEVSWKIIITIKKKVLFSFFFGFGYFFSIRRAFKYEYYFRLRIKFSSF